MNHGPENLPQTQETIPPAERPDVQQRLEVSTRALGRYPEEERRLTLSPNVQAEGLNAVGLVVKNQRVERLTKVTANFSAALDDWELTAGVVLKEDGHGPTLDALDMSLDLGEVSASAHLPRTTLFPEEGEAAVPELVLSWEGDDAQGKITFVPSSEGMPRLWKAQFGTSDVLFKVVGSEGGQSFQVTSLAVESGFALGGGRLKATASLDPTQHAGDVRAQYEVSF